MITAVEAKPFNPKYTNEFIAYLNWKISSLNGEESPEEFKFSHDFIRRLDMVTKKVAKKQGFTYNGDYEYDFAGDLVGVVFPGGKVTMQYPVNLLWNEQERDEYLRS